MVVVEYLGVPDRRRMRSSGDWPDVGNVRDKDRSDLAGDLRERRELERPRDGRATAEDQLRPLAHRELAHLIQSTRPVYGGRRTGSSETTYP